LASFSGKMDDTDADAAQKKNLPEVFCLLTIPSLKTGFHPGTLVKQLSGIFFAALN
jgi:hypothetical protein